MIEETISYAYRPETTAVTPGRPTSSLGAARSISTLASTAARWASRGPQALGLDRGGAGLLHEFAGLMERERNPIAIREALVRLAARASGATRVELHCAAGPGRPARRIACWPTSLDPEGPESPGSTSGTPICLPLGLGGRPWATLHLLGGRRRWPTRTIRLLTTLGVMAAAAERAGHDGGRSDHRDPATGLYTVSHLDALLDHALTQARRRIEPLTLLAVGLDTPPDGDSLEFDAGVAESAVQQVARVVAGTLRASDIVAHLVDGHWLAVLPGAAPEHAWAIATSVRRAVAESGQTTAMPVSLTASIGVASYPDQGSDPARLKAAALHALRSAQARGGDRVASSRTRPGPDPASARHAG